MVPPCKLMFLWLGFQSVTYYLLRSTTYDDIFIHMCGPNLLTVTLMIPLVSLFDRENVWRQTVGVSVAFFSTMASVVSIAIESHMAFESFWWMPEVMGGLVAPHEEDILEAHGLSTAIVVTALVQMVLVESFVNFLLSVEYVREFLTDVGEHRTDAEDSEEEEIPLEKHTEDESELSLASEALASESDEEDDQ